MACLLCGAEGYRSSTLFPVIRRPTTGQVTQFCSCLIFFPLYGSCFASPFLRTVLASDGHVNRDDLPPAGFSNKGFCPAASARKAFVLQGLQVSPIPGAIPSTDNPLSLFGLWRATPRRSGPCCPRWGLPAPPRPSGGFRRPCWPPCTPHPTGFIRVLSKGRSQRQETGAYHAEHRHPRRQHRSKA